MEDTEPYVWHSNITAHAWWHNKPGHRQIWHGPLARYATLRVAHAPGMPGTFSLPPWASDPDMHHGTCLTHVPWCMPGSLTSGFLWGQWRGKRSQHSRRMRNPQFYIYGKRPIGQNLSKYVSPSIPLVPHICASELCQHWFRSRRVACSTPSHYPNQCWFIVNWTLKCKHQCRGNQSTKLASHKNYFTNVVGGMGPFCPGEDR